MDKFLRVAVVLTAYDQMTRVIKQATDDSTRRLKKLQQDSRAAFGRGLAMTGLGIALAAPLVNATNKAIQFEDKMADVAKVMDLKIGSEAFDEMGQKALNLAAALRVPTGEASGLMASLAQGGVIKNQLQEVSLVAGKMGVAFGMASDIAGEKFIKIKNALGVTISETKKVTDAINFLSDNTAAKAEQIVTFMASGGAAISNSMKIAGQDVAAFGSVMISMGKSGEEAGTIMRRFQKGILQNAGMRKIFEQAGGGKEGLLAVLEAGSKAKDPFKFFNKFGQYGVAISQMAQNLDLTKETLIKVADEGNFFNSVQKEFSNRTSTNAGKIQAFKTQMERLSIIFGQQILPHLTKIIEKLGSMAEGMANFASKHPLITKVAIAILAVVSAASIAIGVFNLFKGVVLAYKVAMISMSNASMFAAIKTKLVTAATWLFSSALWANPIVWIVAAILALVAGIVLLIVYWKDIVKWVKESDSWFAKLIRFSLIPIIFLFNGIKRTWTSIRDAFKGGSIMNGIKQIGKSLLQFLLYPLEAILTVVNKVSGGKIGSGALQKISTFRDSLDYNSAGETAAKAQSIGNIATQSQPESVNDQADSQITSSQALQLQGGGGGGGQVGVNFNVNVTGDGEDVVNKLKDYEPELLGVIDEALSKRSRKEF